MAGERLLRQGEATRARMLDFIHLYVDAHGYSPTIAEICEAVDVNSPNAVRNHLLRLQDEGQIRVTPRVARSIVLTEPQPQLA